MARAGASALSSAGGLLRHGRGLTVETALRRMTDFGPAGGKEGLSMGTKTIVPFLEADTCLQSPLPSGA